VTTRLRILWGSPCGGSSPPFRTNSFPIFPLPTEMLGSTFSVGARSGARDRRSRASHWPSSNLPASPRGSKGPTPGSRHRRAAGVGLEICWALIEGAEYSDKRDLERLKRECVRSTLQGSDHMCFVSPTNHKPIDVNVAPVRSIKSFGAC